VFKDDLLTIFVVYRQVRIYYDSEMKRGECKTISIIFYNLLLLYTQSISYHLRPGVLSNILFKVF
jgi:hypothetical protein